MTETEAIEVIALYTNNTLNSFTVYTTFTFAFLATAYFVGRKLSNFQAVVISFLYVLSAGSSATALILYLQIVFEISNNTPSILDNILLFNESFWMYYMATILISGIIIAIYFLWNIRRHKLANIN